MAVIGRLDEQVDAVLIKPLAEKGGRAESSTGPAQPETDAPQTSQTVTQDPGSKNTEQAREELPVWLL